MHLIKISQYRFSFMMRNQGRKITKRSQSVAALCLVALLSTLYFWVENNSGSSTPLDFNEPGLNSRQLRVHNRDVDVVAERALALALAVKTGPDNTVCGRAIGDATQFIQDIDSNPVYSECHWTRKKKTLIIDGYNSYGQDGNQLLALFNAMQYARDRNRQLAITHNSWAMDVITSMFVVGVENVKDWQALVESALCVRVFNSPEQWRYNWSIDRRTSDQKELSNYLFNYVPKKPYNVGRQIYTLRTLYKNINTGDLSKPKYSDREKAGDMCSGIDMLLGREYRSNAKYSAIHHRHIEGALGVQMLKDVADITGCHPTMALDMTPDYIKYILGPLGLLEYPIVVLTDGQNQPGLQRLLNDPVLGPKIRLVPDKTCWYGGDVTLGVMADAFIGNPASAMSVFIGQSRVALELGNNYMYMNEGEQTESGVTGWYATCDDGCLFESRNTTSDTFFKRAPFIERLQ